MPSQNKNIGPAIKVGLVIVMSSFLVACLGGTNAPNLPKTTSGSTALLPREVQAALCQNNPDKALEILSSRPMAAPSDRFFKAVAYERSGQVSTARRLYTGLMQLNTRENVSIFCGDEIIAHGAIPSEAGERLAIISRDMALLDANLRPTHPLHIGLPASTKPQQTVLQSPSANKNVARKTKGPVTSIQAPATNSPFGNWFVHLTSYRSVDNAEKNRPTLEKKYPALKGFIDQWEVDSKGTAIRLGVRLQDKAEAESLCAAIKNSGNYCAVIDTSR